jgi:hypothetical protein
MRSPPMHESPRPGSCSCRHGALFSMEFCCSIPPVGSASPCPLHRPTLSPTSLCARRAPRHRCGARPAFTLCPGRACRVPYTRVRRSPLLSAPAFADIELLPYAISTPTVAPPCLDRHPEVCLSRHLTRPRPCSASLAHRRHARDAISPRSAIT